MFLPNLARLIKCEMASLPSAPAQEKERKEESDDKLGWAGGKGYECPCVNSLLLLF